MAIRRLEIRDIPFYNTVRNECAEYLHDPSTYTLPQAYEWFKSNTNPFFIYELDNQMIGYFRTSNWTASSCYIGMDIHKDYRGKKLAFDAYKEFLSFMAYNYNVTAFFLEVLESNTRALNLYKKLGFIEVERLQYNSYINSIKMKLI